MSTDPANDHQGQQRAWPGLQPQAGYKTAVVTAKPELQELACHTGGVHIRNRMQSTRLIAVAMIAAAATAGHAQTSPYAGEQGRDIKALSDQDIKELQSGHGKGLAKAAELNGYPGPAHVLELADELKLTPQQQLATQSLLARHKAVARELGATLIEAERTLDRSFANHDIDEPRLVRLTTDIGNLQARLRAEHLSTHLQQTALLDSEQVARYAQLRGYASTNPQTTPHLNHH